MKWPVKTKDPLAPNMYRWVEKFAFLPIKTKTHWVLWEKYWQYQSSCRKLFSLGEDPAYKYVDCIGSGNRRAKFEDDE